LALLFFGFGGYLRWAFRFMRYDLTRYKQPKSPEPLALRLQSIPRVGGGSALFVGSKLP
jgi:hypothetical protein